MATAQGQVRCRTPRHAPRAHRATRLATCSRMTVSLPWIAATLRQARFEIPSTARTLPPAGTPDTTRRARSCSVQHPPAHERDEPAREHDLDLARRQPVLGAKSELLRAVLELERAAVAQ